MTDYSQAHLSDQLRARLKRLEQDCTARDPETIRRLREICARPFAEDYLKNARREHSEAFEEECRAIVELIDEALAGERMTLTALFLAWRFGAVLTDRLRARLELPRVEKLSPFVYAMQ